MQENKPSWRTSAIRRHVRWTPLLRARPGRVAALWLFYAFFCIIDAVLFPENWVSSILFRSGTPVFAGMLAGWVLRLRAGALGLIAALCMIGILIESFWLVWRLLFIGSDTATGWIAFNAAAAALVIVVIWRAYLSRSRLRRLAAISLVILANLAAIAFTRTDELFWKASEKAQYLLYATPAEAATEADAPDPMAGITIDRLWEAQQALVAKEVEALKPPVAGEANVYAITVAAGGSQQLFGREAHLALEVAARRFGGSYRGGVLLSNATADLLRHPLASRTNFAAAARGVSSEAGKAENVAFLYLVSHGSDEAFIQTDLPNYQDLNPISASSVAKALRAAGIKRRVVVISACYSASWIPALADDDTIVITAAAKDRTSFGCDDSRELTYFGEAFLKGPLARGASLKSAFEAARSKVTGWEKAEKLEPSKPQAHVGKNMRTIWEAEGQNGGRGRD